MSGHASMPLYTPQLFVDNPGSATMEPSDCVADHPTLQGAQTHILRGQNARASAGEGRRRSAGSWPHHPGRRRPGG